MLACDAPSAHHTTDHTDCDDHNPDVHPEATEVCNDVDDDCDGLIDDDAPFLDRSTTRLYWTDADGDGWGDEAAPTDAHCDT